MGRLELAVAAWSVGVWLRYPCCHEDCSLNITFGLFIVIRLKVNAPKCQFRLRSCQIRGFQVAQPMGRLLTSRAEITCLTVIIGAVKSISQALYLSQVKEIFDDEFLLFGFFYSQCTTVFNRFMDSPQWIDQAYSSGFNGCFAKSTHCTQSNNSSRGRKSRVSSIIFLAGKVRKQSKTRVSILACWASYQQKEQSP